MGLGSCHNTISQMAPSALTVYFTNHPVPSVWEDIDRYVYIGFAADDERRVAGVMIEHFSQWLLVEDLTEGA